MTAMNRSEPFIKVRWRSWHIKVINFQVNLLL
jgi:hypothetical protein